MNDPEEGVVIEEILEPSKDGERTSYFEKRNILDPSPWFLMSFTSKTDDLTMWSQYGDDAQGVCLVLKEDDSQDLLLSMMFHASRNYIPRVH